MNAIWESTNQFASDGLKLPKIDKLLCSAAVGNFLLARIGTPSPHEYTTENPCGEVDMTTHHEIFYGVHVVEQLNVLKGTRNAKLGDTMHKKSESIDDLSVSLDDSRANVSDLESDIRALNRDIDSLSAELAHLEEVDRPQLVNLMQAGGQLIPMLAQQFPAQIID